MMQQRWTIHLIVTLALAIGFAGLAGAAEMMKEDQMGKEKSMQEGMLTGAKDHHASGKIAWDKDMKGHTTLTFSEIEIDKVPDGYVFLAKGGDWRKGVELGKLEKFKGTVSFALPMGVMADEYDTVVIWCKQFNVEIGRGTLPGKMMMK